MQVEALILKTLMYMANGKPTDRGQNLRRARQAWGEAGAGAAGGVTRRGRNDPSSSAGCWAAWRLGGAQCAHVMAPTSPTTAEKKGMTTATSVHSAT